MSGTRWIKTKRENIYRRLVGNLDDPEDEDPDHDVYPFEYGYELFTLGLTVGYLEGEKFEGEYDGEGEYYRIFRFGQLAENNPEHVACIDLFDRLIRLENAASSDDDDPDDEEEEEEEEEGVEEVTWNDNVSYADKGVGILNGEFNEEGEFDVEQYFSTTEFEIENRLDEFREKLTQPPTAGDEGGLTL